MLDDGDCELKGDWGWHEARVIREIGRLTKDQMTLVVNYSC